MGVITSAKVLTRSETGGRPPKTQPGDREWVTVIQSVSSCGYALPPMIILKAKMHLSTWYEAGRIPPDWVIAVSDNGWTTDQLGLIWLKDIFNKWSQPRTIGSHRILIIDGHGSHQTAEFDLFCSKNNIIPLCMPAHSSHLLQPLDVGLFSPLKTTYGRKIGDSIRLGINHIDKEEFLTVYGQIRPAAFSESNIKSSFAAAGLVPYNPDRVLSRLHAQIRTTPPPTESDALQSPWLPQTPRNVATLQHQTDAINALLRRRTRSPSTPTTQALTQLVKGCKMAMHSAALLADENETLRAANHRQKRKRAKKRSFIAAGGALTVAEGIQLAEKAENEEKRPEPVVEQDGQQPQRRAPSRCSKCNSLEHNARTCPQGR